MKPQTILATSLLLSTAAGAPLPNSNPNPNSANVGRAPAPGPKASPDPAICYGGQHWEGSQVREPRLYGWIVGVSKGPHAREKQIQESVTMPEKNEGRQEAREHKMVKNPESVGARREDVKNPEAARSDS
ncbi:hypothetical protein DACRYDRAFT_106515 [Dacryopinax primogenitus]|uniref:Uncharacterized protein n=1 Tax=Dacryopinax primogenitus (strain DJM 731) TaxID=1858805 RepID=M5FZ84_DACPD|nr:uncharacterized protein DACRYDRAFT_106515 [Dacryopinax primogenitus]EJU03356.1 hypothetical protein DACRYDRAFT_106515 [Dacryopinax primogenitus]